MKNFIIQYNPQHTVENMFLEFKQAIKGKKLIQPKNIIIVSDLGIVDKLITKSRLELLACLQEKKPNTVQELANLLNHNYENIQKDIQILSGLDIVKLKKTGSSVRPVALYNRIIFDLSVQETSFPQPVTNFGVK
jgi:predicted transcriptional regulator